MTGEGCRITQREELDRDAVTTKALLIPWAALGLGLPIRAALNWARGPSFGAHTSASSWLLAAPRRSATVGEASPFG